MRFALTNWIKRFYAVSQTKNGPLRIGLTRNLNNTITQCPIVGKLSIYLLQTRKCDKELINYGVNTVQTDVWARHFASLLWVLSWQCCPLSTGWKLGKVAFCLLLHIRLFKIIMSYWHQETGSARGDAQEWREGQRGFKTELVLMPQHVWLKCFGRAS